MRKVLLYITVFLSISSFTFAETNVMRDLIANTKMFGGNPVIVEQTDKYVRAQLNDSATIEMYIADNITIVMTTCAPQCSSCARVYNKEWQPLYRIAPPFPSIFPLASIDKESGRIDWKDNDTWEY